MGSRLCILRLGVSGEQGQGEGENGQEAGEHGAKRDETHCFLQAHAAPQRNFYPDWGNSLQGVTGCSGRDRLVERKRTLVVKHVIRR
ncbi:hypothetical protein AA102526_1945 [Asaia lannensis NBRC 102526]|nr:hypothetical protein AA102526_1945 [Asaia lannensis NBRC 102526]